MLISSTINSKSFYQLFPYTLSNMVSEEPCLKHGCSTCHHIGSAWTLANSWLIRKMGNKGSEVSQMNSRQPQRFSGSLNNNLNTPVLQDEMWVDVLMF